MATTNPANPTKPKSPSYLDPKGPGLSSPAGQRASQSTHRLGETQVKNGHTYELQEKGQRHEWVRVDKGEGAGGQQPAGGGAAPPGGDMGDHKQRHEFTKQQMANISGPAKGVMLAMHAAPEIAEGKPYTTKDFAPEQAGELHKFLRENVGQNTAGGIVRDMGNGWLGFSSTAGAVAVQQNGDGNFTVHYTNQTPHVAESMGMKAEHGEEPPVVGKPQQGQNVRGAPVNELGHYDPNLAEKSLDAQAAQSGQQEPTPPPSRPGQYVPQQQGAPPVVGSEREKNLAQGKGDTGEDLAQASPEQMKSAQALMEPNRPPEPTTPQEHLERSRAELEEATKGWQNALAGGLSPQGNSRWRSYVAARKQHFTNWQAVVKEHNKAGKAARNPDEGLNETEIAAKNADPHLFKQLQAHKDNKQVYEAGLAMLTQGKMSIQAGETPAPTGHKTRQELAAEAFENPEAAASAGGAQASTIKPVSKEQEAMARHGIEPKVDPEAGRRGFEANVSAAENKTPAGRRAKEAKMREEARKGFTVEPPPPVPGAPAVKPKAKKEPKAPKEAGSNVRKRFADLAAKHGIQDTPEVQAAIEAGIKNGTLVEPKHLAAVLKTAAANHGKGDVNEPQHPHVEQAIQSLARKQESRRGAPSIKATNKEMAAQYDMSPEEYDQLTKEMYPDFVAHHKERESLKGRLREITGLNAKAIAKLENSGGKDSDALSKHDKLIASIKDEYPGLLGDDYMEDAWNLLREGPIKPPSRLSPDFQQHVREFLEGNAGSSMPGDDEEEPGSAVPFSKRAGMIRTRYRQWLDGAIAFDLV